MFSKVSLQKVDFGLLFFSIIWILIIIILKIFNCLTTKTFNEFSMPIVMCKSKSSWKNLPQNWNFTLRFIPKVCITVISYAYALLIGWKKIGLEFVTIYFSEKECKLLNKKFRLNFVVKKLIQVWLFNLKDFYTRIF